MVEIYKFIAYIHPFPIKLLMIKTKMAALKEPGIFHDKNKLKFVISFYGITQPYNIVSDDNNHVAITCIFQPWLYTMTITTLFQSRYI